MWFEIISQISKGKTFLGNLYIYNYCRINSCYRIHVITLQNYTWKVAKRMSLCMVMRTKNESRVSVETIVYENSAK